MKKNRRMQAILLAGVLAMNGAMITAIPAFADTNAKTGNITIKNGAENTDGKTNSDVTYHGYLIFHADVKDDAQDTSGKAESNISWANDAIRDAVESVIKTDAGMDENEKSRYTGTTAQDAAEYIKAKFSGENTADHSENVTDGNGTRVTNNSFAYKLARAVKESSKPANEKDEADVTVNEIKNGLSSGYWLFVTDSQGTSGKTDHTGTAPIFTVIGGSNVTVTEKTSIPTVDKKVKNDVEGAPFETGPVDSQMEQEVEYELTGTVADNIGTFDTYRYTFTDALPASMTPDTEHLKVYAVHLNEANAETRKVELKKVTTDVSNPKTQDAGGYTVAYNNEKNELTIDFANLKAVKAEDETKTPVIDADVRIIVDYQAKLDASKADEIKYGGDGNENSVTLTYSNNPFSDGVGMSTPKKVKDYTYRLLLHKIDKTTEANLAGAKFTIQATGADEGIKDGETAKYVQKNGSLGNEQYEFETDKDGNIDVKGLDAGSYTVEETTAPVGYDKTESFTFEIKPEYDKNNGTLKSLANNLRATDSVIAGVTDDNTSDNVLKAKTEGNEAADAKTGTVKITVGDTKKVNLPLTGQSGIATGIAAGGFLIVISAVALEKNRKKNDL